MKTPEKFPKQPNEQLEKYPDLPQYPINEDIYNKFNKEFDIDPEDISKNKIPIPQDQPKDPLRDNFPNDYVIGSDLDIPGSELDDDQEKLGSEDEENNFYSIGGDDHNDLEDDKTEQI